MHTGDDFVRKDGRTRHAIRPSVSEMIWPKTDAASARTFVRRADAAVLLSSVGCAVE